MRWLRRQGRCIAALVSSYVLGGGVVLSLIGLINRTLLGGRLQTVFLFYPATQSYADAVCYRWHQNRFSWQPGLIGMFAQNGRFGLCFAIPNTETQFKDPANAVHVVGLLQRMDQIRAKIGATHKTFAGILPSIFASSGIEDEDILVQRNITARSVLAALDQVIAAHALPVDVPVLVLGGRGYIATEVRRLCVGRNVVSVDAGERPLFLDLIRPWRGHPLIVVNLSKSGVLAEYLGYFWPGVIVLNEVYPEPTRHEIAAVESLGATAYHIAGVKASAWPSFPRAYRGGIPCCASLPLRPGEELDVVVIALKGGLRGHRLARSSR